MGVCTSRPKPSQELNCHSSCEIGDSYDPNQNSVEHQVPAKNSRENGKTFGSFEKNKSEEKGEAGKKSPFFPFYSPSPAHYLSSKKSPARSSALWSGTPRRFFKRPFPPPSPAKHIKAVLVRRHGSVKPNEAAIPEGKEVEGAGLDKSFGFLKNFYGKYEFVKFKMKAVEFLDKNSAYFW